MLLQTARDQAGCHPAARSIECYAGDAAALGQQLLLNPGVGPYRVRLIEHPKYGSPSGTLEFSDLRPGMFVKVEGVYGKDGIFVARKLDDESDQLAKKPELRGRVRVQGRIERTDPSKRTIIMMGTRFIVAPNAQIRSVAKSAPEP